MHDQIAEIKLKILQLIEQKFYEEASILLDNYIEKLGVDEDIQKLKHLLSFLQQPKVLVICIDCTAGAMEQFKNSQTYKNLELVSIQSSNKIISQVIQYVIEASANYICFVEESTIYECHMIDNLVEFMINAHKDLDGIIHERYYGLSKDELFACAYRDYRGVMENRLLTGRGIIEISIENGRNLYGSLSSFFMKTDKISQYIHIFPEHFITEENAKIALYYTLLYPSTIQILEKGFTIRLLKPLLRTSMDRLSRQQSRFHELVRILLDQHWLDVVPSKGLGLPAEYHYLLGKKEERTPLDKKITFFYTDAGEYHNLFPLAEEAKKRGFEISFESNMDEKAVIGVYCQHEYNPKNSQFSIILLHDLTQGNFNWPDHWAAEHWDGFDIGILPGREWCKRWELSSSQYYSNTRFGVYEFGYPKGDTIKSPALWEEVEKWKNKWPFKYDKTILYAPSFEQNGKEEDFIQALHTMEVNLIVKHADWDDNLPQAAKFKQCIADMRRLHEGKYENLYYVETKENIFPLIALSDLVVSDDSSVMTEALLFHVPSISVSEWRNYTLPYHYVFQCSKTELRQYAEDILKGREKEKEIQKWSSELFSNVGKTSSLFIDLVEYYTQNGEKRDFFQYRLDPAYEPITLWN